MADPSQETTRPRHVRRRLNAAVRALSRHYAEGTYGPLGEYIMAGELPDMRGLSPQARAKVVKGALANVR